MLRLRKKTKKKVQFTNETVDNEDLNRKKSKCCCVYVKPKVFGESSSESDDECEHCQGHVEVKRVNRDKKTQIEEDTPAPYSADGTPAIENDCPSGSCPKEHNDDPGKPDGKRDVEDNSK